MARQHLTAPSAHERFVFRHFWDVLAFAGMAGEWTLACWIAALSGVWFPWWAHVVMPPVLFAANRAGAELLERDTGAPAQLGRVLLATGFASFAGAAALVVTACGWVAVDLLQHSAEASSLERVAPMTFGPLFHLLAACAVGLATGLMADGYLRGHRRRVVTERTVALPGLAAALDGLRVVHVSDIHLGPLAHRGALREMLDAVTALAPDVVCVTGDVVDSDRCDLEAWVPELRRLRARLGVYATLGNHDRQAGADRVAEAIRRLTDWHLLRDEITPIAIDGSQLWMVGLEDRSPPDTVSQLPALLAALPAGAPHVLLAHRPSVFAAAAAGRVPLTLVGHTHGGQLAIPGLPQVNAARVLYGRFDAGLFERDGALLHVSRGLGTSGQRVRVGVPCDVTVFRLTRSPTD